MFQKIASFFLAVAVFAATDFSCFAALSEPTVSAESAIVLCASTGEVLYEKDAYTKRAMASTTKIMSALLACESGRLADTVTVTQKMAQIEGTSMGLLAGDTVTIRGLVYGMLLSSGNDAANTVAIALGGSVKAFVAKMNEKAEALGMKNTHFMNPSGLTEDGHYSTAYDMALLAAAALQNEVFASICSSEEAVVYYGNPPYRRVLTNHNRLLSMYDGATGVKTGYTKAAGRCLVSSAQRDGITLIAVTLCAPDDWNDHAAMLDYGFSISRTRSESLSLNNIAIPVVGGSASTVLAEAQADFYVTDGAEWQYAVYHTPFLYAPASAGDVVGFVEIYTNERHLMRVPLYLSYGCERSVVTAEEDTSFMERLLEWIKEKIFFWKDYDES